jgi:hypothetical protein
MVFVFFEQFIDFVEDFVEERMSSFEFPTLSQKARQGWGTPSP